MGWDVFGGVKGLAVGLRGKQKREGHSDSVWLWHWAGGDGSFLSQEREGF